jgi:type I restriction enzyme S subunit
MSNRVDFVRLGDVCTKIGSGATPRGGRLTYSKDGPYTLVRSQNVLNNAFSPVGLVHISAAQAGQLDGAELREGDVLMNITGDSVARVCQVDSLAIPGRVSQHVAIIRPEPSRLDPRYLRCYLTSSTIQSRLLSLASAGATRNALTKSTVAALPIPAPPLSEQLRIAAILGTWDAAIAKSKSLVSAKAIQHVWLSHALIDRSSAVHKWKTVALGDICRPVTRRNGDGVSHVLTSSAQLGLIDQLEYFNKDVSGLDHAGYYLLKRGEFAYNRSSSGGYPFGAIKRLDRYDEGVLSSLYICFEIIDRDVSSDFLRWIFDSGVMDRQLSTICQVGSRAHGLLNVTKSDFFNLRIPIPTRGEQDVIVAALDVAQHEIRILNDLAARYQVERNALAEELMFRPSAKRIA